MRSAVTAVHTNSNVMTQDNINKSVDNPQKSRGSMKRQNDTGVNFFSIDSNGNPSYTIKDGGALKKKV